MWVEIILMVAAISSAASHPLREDVSWNVWQSLRQWKHLGHPLREDVSWNLLREGYAHTNVKSSSSWGCELKCQWLLVVWNQTRHPLREDVSWNVNSVKEFEIPIIVILFVRMWVEMLNFQQISQYRQVILFVRMWVEIPKQLSKSPNICVILFVRMWVEMCYRYIRFFEQIVILFVRMWVEILQIR